MSAAEILQLPPDALKQIPAASAPPGITSNLINPYDRGWVLVVVSTIFLAIGLIAFLVRLFAKVFIIKKLFWDDLTLSLGLLGLITTYIGNILQCYEGPWGKHMWDVSVYQAINRSAVIYNYLSTAFLTITLGFLKLSVLIMYFQIFWPMRWLRIAVYIGSLTTCIFYGTLTIYQLVVSTPRNGASWSQWVLGPEQPKVNSVSLPTGVFGVIMDVFLLILPIPAVLKLQMPKKKKIGVLCIFATGLLACICSGVGIKYRLALIGDNSWEAVNLEIMLQVEMNAGIVIVSMPAMAKVSTQYLPKVKKAWSKVKPRTPYHISGNSHTQLVEKPCDLNAPPRRQKRELDSLQEEGTYPSPLSRAVTFESWAERNSDDALLTTKTLAANRG